MTETSDWRKCRWDATHRRIHETALQLFQDLGFEKVSVSLIAAEAGVSVPTFYAHYPSKEHVVMAPPTVAEIDALLADQPVELPVPERILRANLRWIAQMSPAEFDGLLGRWRIIAGTPALRLRAAEFERMTAGIILRNLPDASETAQVVRTSIALAATTAALLAWADSGGERRLEDTLEEAFSALFR